MRISHRLWLISSLSFLLFISSVEVGWYGLKTSRDSLAHVFERRAIPMQNLAATQKAILKNCTDLLKAYQHDPSGSQSILHKDHHISVHLQSIDKRLLLIDKLLKNYRITVDPYSDESRLSAELESLYQAWNEKFQASYTDLKDNRFSKEILANFLQANENELDNLNEVFDGLIGLQGRIAKEEYEQAELNFNQNQLIYLGLLVIGGGGVFGLVILSIRYITRSINSAGKVAEAIANGDLSGSIVVNSRDEMGELMTKLQRMQTNLIALLQRIGESEERWKFALEGAGDCVWDWNPQTDAIEFSPRWMEIIDCSQEAVPIRGDDWMQDCHPDDREAIQAKMQAYLQGEQPNFAAEFRMHSANSPWKWIFARGKLVSRDQQGRPLRIIGTLTDISETKSLQEQLSQAQKLESIGQLAAGIAHEINTPIQYIGDNLSALSENFINLIGFQHNLQEIANDDFHSKITELAEQYDLPFILEDSPKAIKDAQDGVNRVSEIVKAMKTFSHVETSKNAQAVNLHDALGSALIISRNTYKQFATVETDFSKDISNIECYANELNQVFLNLIINAAHAIEEKNQGLGLIRVSTCKLDDMVEIRIEDNGIGISKEIQNKVFNLFFTTKPVGKGTGQGLSLAHTIVVEKHHGKLFFESAVGQGTCFHIQLPINCRDTA